MSAGLPRIQQKPHHAWLPEDLLYSSPGFWSHLDISVAGSEDPCYTQLRDVVYNRRQGVVLRARPSHNAALMSTSPLLAAMTSPHENHQIPGNDRWKFSECDNMMCDTSHGAIMMKITLSKDLPMSRYCQQLAAGAWTLWSQGLYKHRRPSHFTRSLNLLSRVLQSQIRPIVKLWGLTII